MINSRSSHISSAKCFPLLGYVRMDNRQSHELSRGRGRGTIASRAHTADCQSIGRAHRAAAPVEAPDQLAPDRLLDLARVDAVIEHEATHVVHERESCAPEFRPAIFGLPK